MKIGLKKYFTQNCQKNTELIDLKVIDFEGEEYYIIDFNDFIADHEFPTRIFIGKNKDKDCGMFVDHDTLFVEVAAE